MKIASKPLPSNAAKPHSIMSGVHASATADSRRAVDALSQVRSRLDIYAVKHHLPQQTAAESCIRAHAEFHPTDTWATPLRPLGTLNWPSH